jgi:hypothetical protein
VRSSRLVVAVLVALVALVAAPAHAHADSPRFVDSAFSVRPSGATLTVAGKEVGLGDQTQVRVVVTALALCIDGRGDREETVNRTSAGVAGDVAVRNGRAEFSLTLMASFQPRCAPPMTVTFRDIRVSDITNDVSTVVRP